MTTTVACWRRGFFVCTLTAAAWAFAAGPDDDEGDAEPTPPAIVPAPAAPRSAQGAPTAPAAPVAPGQPQAPAPARMNGNEVLLNFQAADIQAVVKAVS